MDVDALRDLLAELLADGDTAALSELARAVVDGLGALGVGNPAGHRGRRDRGGQGRARAHPVGRPSLLPGPAGAAAGDAAVAGPRRPARPPRARRRREPVRRGGRAAPDTARIAEFRRMVQAEVTARLGGSAAREAAARTGVRPQAEQTDFLSAKPTPSPTCAAVSRPLGRQLATRLAAASSPRSTGGDRLAAHAAPLDVHRRRPRDPRQPQSRARARAGAALRRLGSVAGFSHFTLMLVQALREQFSASGSSLRGRLRRGHRPVHPRRRPRRRAHARSTPARAASPGAGTPTTARAFEVRRALARRRDGPQTRCSSSATPAPTTRTPRWGCSPASSAGPGTRTGSTPNRSGSGGPATRPRASTARSCRCIECRTAPSWRGSSRLSRLPAGAVGPEGIGA